MRYEEQIVVMRAVEIRRALDRIASEILEKNNNVRNVYLVGIRTGGAHLAERLRKRLTKSEGEMPGFGIVDIGLYRDDVFTGSDNLPVVGTTEIFDDLTGKDVVLVDDVIFTGRTIRAAMDAVIDFGRPARIELAVLIDRGLREFPIHPDCVGRIIPTSRDERVTVELTEEGFEEDCVVIIPQTQPVAAPVSEPKPLAPAPAPAPAPKPKAKTKSLSRKSAEPVKAAQNTIGKTVKDSRKKAAKPDAENAKAEKPSKPSPKKAVGKPAEPEKPAKPSTKKATGEKGKASTEKATEKVTEKAVRKNTKKPAKAAN